MLYNETLQLLKKEFSLEWKQKYAFSGILLYIASTIFVCYLSFKKVIDVDTWNALFWIILLFGSVNAVAKSFLQETEGKLLYYYTVASAEAIILSKTIYNTLLLILLGLLSFGMYSLVLQDIVANYTLFLITLILGCSGLASTFTLISGIASKANNSSVLMAILGFPLILPLLLMIIRLSKRSILNLQLDQNVDDILILALLNLITVVLSYILFPYLWRD